MKRVGKKKITQSAAGQDADRTDKGLCSSKQPPANDGVARFFTEAFGTPGSELGRSLGYHLLHQSEGALPPITPEEKKIELAAAIGLAIKPQDTLEGLLAIQMAGIHNLLMMCLMRANLPDQTPQGIQMNVDRATKLARTFAAQLEALNRHRGKGQQKIVVQHLAVNEGGQAMVGIVEKTGDGGRGGQ